MSANINRFLARAMLALALAMPVLITIEMTSAQAHHKNWRRGAAIAGAIVGGAIIYHNYRKNRKYRHHGRYYRGHGRYYRHSPRYRVRHHHHGYYHRHGHRGHLHYHRY